MKALVTGATGLVGSALVHHLLDAGWDVRILRRPQARLDLLGPAALAVEHALGDVTDPASLAPAFAGVTHVFHAAAYVGFGGRRARQALYAVNVEGTAHVVDAALAAGVARLVHTSSIAALGRPAHPAHPLDEAAAWHASRANSEYALSKHRAELEVQRGLAEGLDAVIVNPALVFGVGRTGENTRRLVDRVHQGRLPGIPRGGTNVVDVLDVAAGHLLALNHGRTGERYVLGGQNLAWRDIIQTLAGAFGVRAPRWSVPPALGFAGGLLAEGVAWLRGREPQLSRETARAGVHFYQYSSQKAIAELGYTFRPFSDTAHRLADSLATPL